MWSDFIEHLKSFYLKYYEKISECIANGKVSPIKPKKLHPNNEESKGEPLQTIMIKSKKGINEDIHVSVPISSNNNRKGKLHHL
ncbi:unnamed protein product [Blepharisma stoltei]|uniref:Uncharacterized protein n=1 Tax=Blepharisma stoltei TaxID=1481888 RepID=A0AAU9IZL7_9CILI|nr:unnamed protein product [Blepharisma stoltei]